MLIRARAMHLASTCFAKPSSLRLHRLAPAPSHGADARALGAHEGDFGCISRQSLASSAWATRNVIRHIRRWLPVASSRLPRLAYAEVRDRHGNRTSLSCVLWTRSTSRKRGSRGCCSRHLLGSLVTVYMVASTARQPPDSAAGRGRRSGQPGSRW